MSYQPIWDHYQSVSLHTFAAAEPRLRRLVDMAARRVPAVKARVLNVGIGDATLERLALARGWEVHALDPSSEPVGRCRTMGVDARVGVLEALPYEANFFDAIFCSEVFEHLTAAQLELGLREVTRTLRPSACLYGTVPFGEHLDDQMAVCPHCGTVFHRWGHQQSFDVAGLRTALQQTLNVKTMFVTPLVDWSRLNWKGRSLGLLKKVLAMAGIHGTNENIVFVCGKR